MHFKISRKVLSNYLNIVSKAVSFKSPIPALSGIKIVVENDYVFLTASNTEISIRSKLNISDEENELFIFDTGSILIDSEYIMKVCNTIDSKIIDFELIDGSLIKISGDRSEFKINGMKSDDFPTINFSPLDQEFLVDAEVLDDIIDATVFAASEERTRPALTGVNFKSNGTTLKCVASDSYRLAQKSIDINNGFEFNIIIPAFNLKKLQGIGKGTVKVSLNQKYIMFEVSNNIIKVNLIDDRFPDTDRLIPSQFINELVVDSSDLLKIVERASFIAYEKSSAIKLSANNSEIIISSNSQEIGSYTDNLTFISFEGDPLEISFNGTYLKEALKVFRNTKCKISFSGTLKPFTITSDEDESLLQLLVPVRTY